MGWRQQAVEAAERRIGELEAELARVWAQVGSDAEDTARIRMLEGQRTRLVEENMALVYEVARLRAVLGAV